MELELRMAELQELMDVQAVGGKLRADRKVKIETDSRSLTKGSVFWVLKGENFDGHAFVEGAFEKGVIAAVVDKSWFEQEAKPGRIYLPVEDTHQAILALAGRYARRFRIPRVAVAGANGKTTTKEMIAAVLSRRGRVVATQANHNNHVGVPLTLFRINSVHDYAVIEAGTSNPGEIAPLSRAIAPSCAVLTNIGPEHLERFGDLAGVRKEELQITAGMEAGSTLFVNADDPNLANVRTTRRYRVLGYGIRRGAVRPTELAFDENGCASFKIGRTRFRLGVPGVHNVYNALAAISVGMIHRVPKGEISRALSEFLAVPGRMNVIETSGLKVLDDCYNANPASLRAAVEILAQMRCDGRRIAVLGDMLELGESAVELHRSCGAFLAEMDLDQLLCVGPLGAQLATGARKAGMASKRIQHFETLESLVTVLLEVVEEKDCVLVKGSHGMKLEKVVKALQSRVQEVM
jgi:UDP-N-acetylmuramoyl-tripeptide--D-alanyl-D-alanine ligase